MVRVHVLLLRHLLLLLQLLNLLLLLGLLRQDAELVQVVQ